MARYVRFEEFGGPEVLTVVHGEPPTAGPGEVRVRVHAAGLNPVDWKILHGAPAATAYGAGLPSGNGNDFSGVIDQLGAGVSTWALGDAVLGGKRMFAQADWLVVDASAVIRKPDALGFVPAGALDIAGRTAWATVRALALTPDDTVLVSAAAGGVGVLAVQLALRTGATVVGTASAENHEFLRGLGVIPVAYGEGLVERVRALVPRVTAALDNNGPATIDAALELGVPGARINTIAARGHRTDAGVTGIGGQNARPGDLAALATMVAAGDVVLPIDRVFPLEDVVAAYRHLMAGHLRGKVLLTLE